MAVRVKVIPQAGVVVDGRAIRLGGGKADVEQILGHPDTIFENSLYYFENELRIVLDKAGRVEFIELLGGPDGTFQPVLFGLEAFQADPEAVVGLLKEKNGADFLDTEKGYSYAFKKLSVGLYRESVPQNVPEMIEEAEADGNPLSEEDIEYEKRRTHWATVGIGVENYYT